MKKEREVIPPGIEPGTLSVLDSRDNRYTMESPVEGSDHFNYLSNPEWRWYNAEESVQLPGMHPVIHRRQP